MSAIEQARAQLESVCTLVHYLGLPWDQRDEILTDDPEEIEALSDADRNARIDFIDAENDHGITDEYGAREAIEQDALSVEVRTGWYAPGEESTPEEFRIVLCTGGPHVEIRGELNRGEPSSARLMYQDWGTPLTELVDISSDNRASLLTYCRVHYFGE